MPVGVGVAPTKSLAKIANHIAKKREGVFIISTERERDWALRNTPIDDVWGIGRQYTTLLKRMGINTAFEFTQLSTDWIRNHMTVTGHRLREELLGNPCLIIETVMPAKKNIATTRAFGKKISDIDFLREAVSTYAVKCAGKLRRQKSVASFITVFIHTDPFSEREKYISRSLTLTLPIPSNSDMIIAKAALYALSQIFQPNLLYKKAGVIVSGITSDVAIQGNLFVQHDNEKLSSISQVSDYLNTRYGKGTVQLAIQGSGREWRLKQEKLSPGYTTKWNDILDVKA